MRLARAFPIDLHGFAIMDNHFHIVVHYDPLAHQGWSDFEVARRWLAASAPQTVLEDPGRLHTATQALLDDPKTLEKRRRRLGSLSAFMQQLKQPIARIANQEDCCKGHFFEQRFYSGALLSENALVAAMAYVDLNPVRARIAKDISSIQFTSLTLRLQENTPERLKAAIAPIASGLDLDTESTKLRITMSEYLKLLRDLIALQSADKPPLVSPEVRGWEARVRCISKPQRAFGTEVELNRWLSKRRMDRRETPFE